MQEECVHAELLLPPLLLQQQLQRGVEVAALSHVRVLSGACQHAAGAAAAAAVLVLALM
jgi:hypothetical protein